MPTFTVDPAEIFKQVIGPYGGYVLLGLFFLGFAFKTPWWFFAREVLEERGRNTVEMAKKDARIKDLETQNAILVQMLSKGTAQAANSVTQTSQLAELVTQLASQQKAA